MIFYVLYWKQEERRLNEICCLLEYTQNKKTLTEIKAYCINQAGKLCSSPEQVNWTQNRTRCFPSSCQRFRSTSCLIRAPLHQPILFGVVISLCKTLATKALFLMGILYHESPEKSRGCYKNLWILCINLKNKSCKDVILGETHKTNLRKMANMHLFCETYTNTL